MSRTGWLGRLFAVGLLTLLWIPAAALLHASLPAPRMAATLAVLALFVAVYVAYWVLWPRGRPLPVTLAVLAALTVLGALFNLASAVATVNPFIFPIVVAGFALPLRPAVATVLLLTVLAFAAVLLQAGLNGLNAAEIALIFGFVGLQLLLLGGGAIGLARLLATLKELREARETIARLAVAEERSRFARDLHDLLGHSLSLITLKGELAAQLVETRPAQARRELDELVAVARESLREVREAIGGYRRPTLASELAAARTALDSAGIELVVDEHVGALTGPVEAVLAWTIREGVTNVARHSGARRCRLRLAREEGLLSAEVLDDGPAGGPLPAPGNGLQGVRERAEALGGRVEMQRPRGGGFRLLVTVPEQPPPRHVPEPVESAVSAGR